jgi:hypothetical protein
MTDIQDAMANAVGKRGKKTSPETPVGKENGNSSFNLLEREHVPEEIRGKKKRFHLAVSASEEVIRFLQNRGCPALRALVLDLNSGCLCHDPLHAHEQPSIPPVKAQGERLKVQTNETLP